VKKPNIILITVDQMRGDCLGVKGHPVIETPYLDMMCRNGVMFTNAYSAVPSCIAARAAIMTGLSQASHGRVGYQDKVEWNYEHTLPGELAADGYYTKCVGKMHVYPERKLCGFHDVELHDGYLHYSRNYNSPTREAWNQCDDYLPWLRERLGPETDMIDTGLDCNSWVARPWMYDEYLHPTNWVVTRSIDFLRRKDPTKPFFLMMSFVRPHAPLDPPEVYFNQYINEDIPKPPIGDWADKEDNNRDGLNVDCLKGIINDKALKRARAAYYGCITHIDHQIGRFIQLLGEYGHLNDSIIIFTSDHGDMLGDHNFFRKSLGYEGSANIPFIVYDPGNILGCKKGQVFDNVLELRDIMPTILNMAGADIPDSIEGKSILPIIQDENAPWREYIHGEHSYGDLSNHYITNGREKYIWYSQTGREQYFDLVNDREEMYDLSKNPDYKDRIGYWRSILVKELEGREEGYSDGKNLVVGRPVKSCLNHIMK
jgi:arylsulfatase